MELKRHPGLSLPPIPNAPPPREVRGRILLVDDDAISRRLLNTFLKRDDYEVMMADGVDQAMTLLKDHPLETFDVVVTDYRMPGKDGLWLLEWLQKSDPRLSTIMVTAEGEQQLVTATLRRGVCDFLEKPVDPRALAVATEKAVALTRRRRSEGRAQSDVQAVGLIQQRMVESGLPSSGLDITLCYRPMHEAGGDYFIALPLGDEQFLIMATDVSGHDLRAAYLSAYFQGFVRGMIEKEACMRNVLSKFNEHLLRETETSGSAAQGTSVAVSAVLFQRSAMQLQSISCGFPPAVYSDGAGQVISLGDTWSSPLGWFADTVEPAKHLQISPGSCLHFWTDGLEDLASQLGVLPMSCAYDLLRARANGATPIWMKQATDDILVTRVALTPPVAGSPEFLPIMAARYPGSDHDRVDSMQETWVRSLKMALPELSDERTYDVLLCLREVVLNALKHGCRGQSDQWASIMISWDPKVWVLRVIVSDSGPGHSFDWRQHQARAEAELIDAHRGLVLIGMMTTRFETQRNGAHVEMDFQVDPLLKKVAASADAL